MPFPIHYLKVSQVSKYEISITLLLFLICLGKSCLNPNAKVQKIRDMPFNNHGLYFDLQFNTSVFPLRLNRAVHHLM